MALLVERSNGKKIGIYVCTFVLIALGLVALLMGNRTNTELATVLLAGGFLLYTCWPKKERTDNMRDFRSPDS